MRALVLLATTRLLLRRHGTTGTLQRLARQRQARPVAPEDALTAMRRARYLVGGRCLPQAIALTALLQQGGNDPVLVLGCHRRPNGSWDAHAWTRVDGRVLDPDPSGDYAELAWCRREDDWVPAAPAEPRF
jgi:hypothetical protein